MVFYDGVLLIVVNCLSVDIKLVTVSMAFDNKGILHLDGSAKIGGVGSLLIGGSINLRAALIESDVGKRLRLYGTGNPKRYDDCVAKTLNAESC